MPARDSVGEVLADDAGVLSEAIGGVPIQPSATLLERERGVPVEQCRGWRNSGPKQAINQAVVEVEPGGVGPAFTSGLDARPREREAVGVDAQLFHECDVLRIAVIVVGRYVAVAGVQDAARLVAERIPAGGATAILVRRALDLVRGGGHAKKKTVWQSPRMGKVRMVKI
jgi:hypothetical protein